MAATVITFPAASIQLATTPGDTLYTCPLATRARITMLSFLNTTANPRTVSVHLVRSGGAIGVTNQVWNAAAVPATATQPKGVVCYEAINQVLNPGDFIKVFADAGTAITPVGSVVEFS